MHRHAPLRHCFVVTGDRANLVIRVYLHALSLSCDRTWSAAFRFGIAVARKYENGSVRAQMLSSILGIIHCVSLLNTATPCSSTNISILLPYANPFRPYFLSSCLFFARPPSFSAATLSAFRSAPLICEAPFTATSLPSLKARNVGMAEIPY